MSYDVERVRKDFPILSRQVHGKPLVYLDNAASSQKPRVVIDALSHYYEHYHSNTHRGVHQLATEATDAYEGARAKLAEFVGAADPREIVFVRGTTEAINLVAQAWLRPRVEPGDEILITHLEHHSNIVPWQLVCEQTGAVLKVAPIDERGVVIPERFAELLSERTRLAAFSHVSNALGTVLPAREMTALAKQAGAVVLIDGAQAVPHMEVDVADLGCDFYAWSGHKMYGPTGIGALYGRSEVLADTDPYQGGGMMIRSVRFGGTSFAEPPHRFEAGTPNVAGAIGLGVAAEYLMSLGRAAVAAHEHELLAYATERLDAVPGLVLYGRAPEKSAVLSFTLGDIHAHDLGTILDREGVAVRAGHHCAQPVMEFYGVPATARASLGAYTTKAEIDTLVSALHKAIEIFAT